MELLPDVIKLIFIDVLVVMGVVVVRSADTHVIETLASRDS